MRLFILITLVMATASAFYLKDNPIPEFLNITKTPIKKLSAVKPASLIKKAKALPSSVPRFTFFETLSDTTMTKYVGLKGEMLPVSLSAVIKPARSEPDTSRDAKPDAPIPEIKKSTTPHFAVQVSSFRDVKRAGALKMKLQQKGYDAFLMETQLPGHGGKWHRVFLGRYNSESKARKVAKRARQEHQLNSVVVRKTN